MPRSLIRKIASPDQGIFLDRPKDVIPPRGWSDLNNVQCIDGVIKTSPGWLKHTSQQLADAIRRLDQFFKLDNTDFAVAITLTKFYYFDVSSDLWTDKTGATALTGTIDDFVDADTAFDLYVFCDNAGRVKKWASTSTDIANLSGLTSCEDGSGGGTIDCAAAKTLTSFAGFLHLGNTVENANRQSQRWRWSRFLNPEGWDNVASYGQAGYADITDGPDRIQRMKRIGGDFLAIYKERSIHIAQYVGPPTVWARRLAVSGIGLIAPGAVADLGAEHVFIGNENIYIYNGLSLKPIGDRVFSRFINELNPLKQHLIWAHVRPNDNEIIFAYPSGGNSTPNRAMVYNYFDNTWVFRDMPFMTMGHWRRTDSADTWDSDSDTWDSDITRWDDTHYAENSPLHLAGDDDGYVYNYGDGYSVDGAALDSYAISPAIDAQRPEIIKRYLKILVDLVSTGTHSLMISYLTVNNKNATLSWSAAKSILCDLSTAPWVTLDISGRWLYIRFRTNGISVPWELSGYGYEYHQRGRY